MCSHIARAPDAYSPQSPSRYCRSDESLAMSDTAQQQRMYCFFVLGSTGTDRGLIPRIVYFGWPPTVNTCADAPPKVVETFVMKSLAGIRALKADGLAAMASWNAALNADQS